MFYLFLTPTVLGYLIFGILSGPVSYALVRRIEGPGRVTIEEVSAKEDVT